MQKSIHTLSACDRSLKPRNKCGITINRNAGFSLVQMSMVLVIIGLVIGGVIVGKELIKSSKLRSVISDIEKFNAAANAFQNKYNCIPGDCKNASDYFGLFATCASSSATNNTCNGDGDGQVKLQSPAANFSTNDESVLFWQHLSLSGLLAGKYSGVLGSGPYVGPTNAPMSQLEGGCYSVDYSSSSAMGAGHFVPMTIITGGAEGNYQNFFAVGNPTTDNGTGIAQTSCTAGLYSLPAFDAYNIDQKIDDGRIFDGNVQASSKVYGGDHNWSERTDTGVAIPGCASYYDSATMEYSWVGYDISIEKTACQLFFNASF